MGVTRQDIKRDLRKLGLSAGDKLVMHSSLSSLGYVEGGADAVIDCVLDSIAPGGTLIVPTMTFGNGFNPRTSPSCTGHITEVLRNRPDAIRSMSPSHSLAAIGPDAERLLEGHGDTTSPLGIGSPLHRLAEDGGYVLLLGVTHHANSTIHVAQYIAGLPWLDITREVKLYDDTGSVTDKVRLVNPGCSKGFDALEPYLIERGIIKYGAAGDAQTRLMKGYSLIECAADVLKTNPALLLCDEDSDCEWCSRAHRILKAS